MGSRLTAGAKGKSAEQPACKRPRAGKAKCPGRLKVIVWLASFPASQLFCGGDPTEATPSHGQRGGGKVQNVRGQTAGKEKHFWGSSESGPSRLQPPGFRRHIDRPPTEGRRLCYRDVG